jgi:hypothetical protein
LKPVVVALTFGVFIAFFVTLLLVPAMYTIGVDINRAGSRVRGWIGDRLPAARRRAAQQAD